MKPKDFLTVEEAIELINTDTRTNPTVDDVKLVKGIEYLRANQRGGILNYTIHLVKRDEHGRIVSNGVKYAQVASSRDANTLEYAIVDHYKALSGKDAPDPESMGLATFTTTMEEDSGYNPKPRRNTSSKIKKGDDMKTGSGTQTVGKE